MYKVIVRFSDAQDDNYIYEIGDKYPRKGKEVSDARIAELASAKNGARKVLIVEVEEEEPEVTPEAPEMPQIEPEAENQDIKADEEKPKKGK